MSDIKSSAQLTTLMGSESCRVYERSNTRRPCRGRRLEACCKACSLDLSWRGWTWTTHSNSTADLTAEAQQLLTLRQAQLSLTESLRKTLSTTSCGRIFHRETCEFEELCTVTSHASSLLSGSKCKRVQPFTCASLLFMLWRNAGVLQGRRRLGKDASDQLRQVKQRVGLRSV